jgi:hypothetical protein
MEVRQNKTEEAALTEVRAVRVARIKLVLRMIGFGELCLILPVAQMVDGIALLIVLIEAIHIVGVYGYYDTLVIPEEHSI